MNAIRNPFYFLFHLFLTFRSGTAALLLSSRIGSSRSTVYRPPSASVTVCTKKGVLVGDGCGSRVK